ncbi:MAG: flavodoxin family protein [Spirochaetes bacterium]|nr:flavodoxin family protein [Spirochaetota bacterium]
MGGGPPHGVSAEPGGIRTARVLAVYGSPRQGGSTDTLLDFFLHGVEEATGDTERIVLRDLDILPCTACDGCRKSGRCILTDDMTGLYEKLVTYERIVCAFPVFFMGPPAIAKAFFDRAQALWIRRFVLGENSRPESSVERKGYLLSACGYVTADQKRKKRFFSCSETIVRAFFSACGVLYDGSLLFSGIEGPADIDKDPTLKKRVTERGRRWIGPLR